MKKIEIYKSDLQQALSELTAAMQEKNWFINIETREHKNPEKLWIVIG